MAIVPLSKVTLYGIADHKEVVLGGLQDLGCTHLVKLAPGKDEGRPERGYSVEAHEALQYLQACPVHRQQAVNIKDFDFGEAEREALETRRRERELSDEREVLVKAVEATSPWGEFHLPEEEHPELRFWFYVVPHVRMNKIEELDLVWQAVARGERFDYVLVVHPGEPQGMPVKPVTLDPRPLSQLTGRLEEVELELEKLHWHRVELTRWCQLMVLAMARADDQAFLEYAGRQTLDESRIFAVQGWAPRAAQSRIEEFAEQYGLAFSIADPEPEENPPTLLDNPELLAGGESTVTFYMTPGYRTWDPSLVVFFSFAVFFGMIFSDAGYGLMLGAILLVAWPKLGHSRTNIRLRYLFLALVIASVGYGVMVGSYFGVSPGDDSMLGRFLEWSVGRFKVLDMSDQSGMMLLSIVVGAFHIMLANLITAWRHRGTPRFFAGLGWAAMILGGLILGVTRFGGDGQGLFVPIDIVLLVGGALGVLLFSSDRPLGGSVWAPVLRLLDGFQGLTNISKAFGDVLSYLRLFALGLASAQLAVTFNDIAGSISKVRGVGLLLAILILVFGHGLNFTLAIIGGVVHGLRLNCIEFFNWSLSEEGYPFQPFCKKASE